MSITFSHFFRQLPPEFLVITKHIQFATLSQMTSDDLDDDEVLVLLGATACVLLACMCRPKSDVNDRGSITRRVGVGNLFRRRYVAGLNRNYKRQVFTFVEAPRTPCYSLKRF
jgi:hypothetical protein